MATTTEKRPHEPVPTVRRSSGLVFTIVLLVIALAALGAYVLFDLLTEPETAATTEVTEVLDAYETAWMEADSEAFLAVTTEDYVSISQGVTFDLTERATTIATLGSFEVTRLGELVMTGDGPEYFVTTAEEITWAGTVYEGVSAFRIVETPDGLRIAEHYWVGDL